MKVWLSRFTYQRLIEGLGEEMPILHTNEHGFVRVDLPVSVIDNAQKNFGLPLDKAINELINENQRRGLWPQKTNQ